jgi:sulfopyruvate decarboxylase subunit alpha
MRTDHKGREIFDLKSTATEFAAELEKHFNYFTSVPDSVYNKVLVHLKHWEYPSRENHAVAMAFGAHMAGARPCVLIQNSGLGLCIDSLLGTFRLYNQGLMLVVTNRGILEWEEIQHQDWGVITTDLLKACQIPVVSFNEVGLDGIRQAAERARNNEIVVLLLERGNIDE